MKRKTFRSGGGKHKKKKDKRRKHLKPHMSKPKKGKPKKGKPKKKKYGVTVRRKNPIFISQPKKRRYTINVRRRKPHIRSMSYSDSSMFSSGTGMKPNYKRRAMLNQRVDDMNRGAYMVQDNDKILFNTFN